MSTDFPVQNAPCYPRDPNAIESFPTTRAIINEPFVLPPNLTQPSGRRVTFTLESPRSRASETPLNAARPALPSLTQPESRRASQMMEIDDVLTLEGNSEQSDVEAEEMEWSVEEPEVPARLYHDVDSGFVPEHHAPLDANLEIDSHNGPYYAEAWHSEMARAECLSHQMIQNAPPWQWDLPWDELRSMGITLDEFIIYFPNHVARWPCLALWVRCQNWDRLFYRMARLINLARGTHLLNDRDYQHVEVLPLMMKMQRAIQELEPTYELSAHDNVQMDAAFIKQKIHAKPARFTPGKGMCTLAMAAGYVTGVNEFEHYKFSRKMRELFPRAARAPKRQTQRVDDDFPFAELPPRRGSGQGGGARRESRGTGWVRGDVNAGLGEVFSDDRDGGDSLFASASGTPTPTASTSAYADDEGYDTYLDGSDDSNANTPTSSTRPTPTRPTPQPQHHAQKMDRICTHEPNCRNKRRGTCRFLHPGDANYTQVLNAQVQKPFRGNANQQQHHQKATATASQQAPNQQPPGGGRNNDNNGDGDKPRGARECHHALKCTRANCTYAHPGPRTQGNVDLDLRRWCRFKEKCTKANCVECHPSPAAAAGGKDGGKGGESEQ